MIPPILFLRRPDTNLILPNARIQYWTGTNPYSSTSLIHLPVIQCSYPFDWRTNNRGWWSGCFYRSPPLLLAMVVMAVAIQPINREAARTWNVKEINIRYSWTVFQAKTDFYIEMGQVFWQLNKSHRVIKFFLGFCLILLLSRVFNGCCFAAFCRFSGLRCGKEQTDNVIFDVLGFVVQWNVLTVCLVHAGSNW